MTFGRTTFGSLYDIVPGSSDIFIRRFQMGVHLSGILLAGIGVVILGRLVARRAHGACCPRSDGAGPPDRPAGASSPGRASWRSIVVLAPAWTSMDTYDAHNATNIGAAGRRRRAAGPPDRPAARRTSAPTRGTRLRRPADELGGELPRGRGARVQVPREQGRRRGRVHAAHGVAHDRPRVLLRRHQPGRLPALRHRLHPHPRLHGPAGAGRQGWLLGDRLPVGAPRPRVHPRVRHDRRADRDPGRRRLAERDPAGLTPARPSSATSRWPSTGRPGRPPRPRTRPRCRGPPGHVVAEHADLADGHAGAVVRTSRRATVVLERVLRPRLARHGRRPPGADGDGGAGAGRRRGGPGRAHGRLQLRRLRLLRRCSSSWRWPSSPSWPSWPWRRWSGAGCGGRPARAASTRMEGDDDQIQP